MYRNKKVLITGGTGSFGSMFLEKILNYNPKEIIILSRDEEKQNNLRNKYLKYSNIKFVIGDIRDYESINKWFYGIDYVVHAAALKQVPSCEYHPIEAMKTNIIGSNNVMLSAINNNVKKLVFLSTDKAVYPINAMGISKSFAEKNLIALSRNIKNKNTILNIIRYGNVIGSRGSVIRRFISQIKSKKPITITSPNMTRFFMSLNDAIHLLNIAIKNGKHGETFIQLAPSVKIIDLAEAIKQIFNYKKKIKTIGVRHGEKLYEVLISEEESMSAQYLGKNLCKLNPDNRNLNYEIYFNKGIKKKFKYPKGYNSSKVETLTTNEIKKILYKEKIIQDYLNA